MIVNLWFKPENNAKEKIYIYIYKLQIMVIVYIELKICTSYYDIQNSLRKY